jgi:hypothetical protein
MAERRLIAHVNRQLTLLFAATLLFLILVLIINGFQARWAALNAGLRLVFGVGCGLAGFLLVLTMVISLGAMMLWGNNQPRIFPTGDLRKATQESLLREALNKLSWLEKRGARLEVVFRIAALACLIAILFTCLAWAISSL